MNLTADFETTVDKNDCRVWAWALCEIDNPESVKYGNNLDSFMSTISNYNCKIYFHNLKFDGEFIVIWLLQNGFEWVDKKPKEFQFSTLIDNSGKWYSVQINYGTHQNKIYDSLKIIPFSIEKLPKMFGLKESKLKIDYTAKRNIGHELTEHEKNYINHDVVIAAKALHTLFEHNMTSITQGSNALNDYKNRIGKRMFRIYFPITKYDHEIRQAYKGGFTYLNPKFKGKVRGKGIVLDVNSLYPWVMRTQILPYGEPIYFEGKYKKDKNYPLYIQIIRCQFKIKKDHVPTIQIKNTLSFMPTEYLTTSETKDGDEEVTMCLTSVDLQLFFDHYEIYNLEYLNGYKFQGYHGFFDDYIDYWMEVKINSQLEGNEGMRTLAKLMLNALYGKFGTNPNVRPKIPYLEDDTLKMKNGDIDTRDSVYCPMACFITAYAREKTIRSAQSVYDRFMYADTDSLHLKGWEIPENLDIHDTKLGAWKLESKFNKCKYIRQKTYIENCLTKNGTFQLKVTCAGLPHTMHQLVTFDNFNAGMRYFGKLKPVHVKGGIVMQPDWFTIRG